MPGIHGEGCCNCSEDSLHSGSPCLLNFIDLDGIRGLNEAEPDSTRTIFKPFSERLDNTGRCQSEQGDHELIIHVPFSTPCKLTGIHIIGGENGASPKKVKLFVNNETLDFLSIADVRPTQELDLIEDFCGVLEYPVKVSKFTNVSHLTFYFTETYGENCTELFYIGLRGIGSSYKRSAVITVYESQANLKDHSVKEDKNMYSSFGI